MNILYKKIKKLGQGLYWLLFTALIVIAAFVALSAIDIPENYKLLSVQSGSMEPAIPIGSVLLTKPSSAYQVEDVITFRDIENPNYLITHRIVEVENLENGSLYVTKGDANEDADSERIEKDLVVGKVIWSLPLIGYVVSFARTQVGLILLIVIPVTIIVYSEILAIKREFKKLSNKDEDRRNFFKKHPLRKVFSIVLIFLFIQIGTTSSSYLDIENSTGNTMTAGVWEEEVELLFYLREADENAVGFYIQGVAGHDTIEYEIRYEHDVGLEVITGTIDNSSANDAYLREYFELGTCSGSVCTYHEGIEQIDLEINLLIGGGVDNTLNRAIVFP